MVVFNNIPHVERFVFKRTFMNEITLLFIYNPIKLEECKENVIKVASSIGISINQIVNNCIILKDKDALLSLTENALVVSLPSREYKNFTTTTFLWNHVEELLKTMKITPTIWTFTKGNRWVFSKAIPTNMEKIVYNFVLSKNLLDVTDDNHFYAEEANDKSCVFFCRYGIEKINDKEGLSLKTMITVMSYTVNDLCKQVFQINELMFDCWYWSVNDRIKELMNKEKNG